MKLIFVIFWGIVTSTKSGSITLSIQTLSRTSQTFAGNIRERNEKDIKIRVLFLRSTFVLLRKNRERWKAKVQDRKTFSCCHHRTLEVINCVTLAVFRIHSASICLLSSNFCGFPESRLFLQDVDYYLYEISRPIILNWRKFHIQRDMNLFE